MRIRIHVFKILFLLIAILAFCANAFAVQPAEKAEVCSPGRHWRSAYHRKAYYRTDGTFFSASNVSAGCQDNPPSYAKWKERLKSNGTLPDWAKNEKRKVWSTEEQERTFEALSELPQELLFDSVKAIYRAEKSQEFDKNPATGDEGSIILYDLAFSDQQKLARILAHEFAHELFRRIPDTQRMNYARSAGWKEHTNRQTGEVTLLPGRLEYVEEDSLKSVTEDFANNVEYYLFDRKKLERVNPQASKWLQTTFTGKLKLGKGTP